MKFLRRLFTKEKVWIEVAVHLLDSPNRVDKAFVRLVAGLNTAELLLVRRLCAIIQLHLNHHSRYWTKTEDGLSRLRKDNHALGKSFFEIVMFDRAALRMLRQPGRMSEEASRALDIIMQSTVSGHYAISRSSDWPSKMELVVEDRTHLYNALIAEYFSVDESSIARARQNVYTLLIVHPMLFDTTGLAFEALGHSIAGSSRLDYANWRDNAKNATLFNQHFIHGVSDFMNAAKRILQ